MRGVFIYSVAILSAFAVKIFAEPRIFESGEERVQLLELYTSQGCSSCPPVERWLNGFEIDESLWKEVVPVAFHVDYWDRLGWKDPFASFENTSRQYLHHQAGNVRSVYTPGFVVNGKEWRGWFERKELPNESVEAGNLRVSLDGLEFEASYSGSKNARTLHIAILGMDIRTHVERGENRNRDLRQSFVSLATERYELDGDGWKGELPQFDREAAKRYAIAVWVTAKGDLEPLQATGSWLSL